MNIGILDYGACNLLSVYNSIYRLGENPRIIRSYKDFNFLDKIIIPGVGSAYQCIRFLKDKEIFNEIKNFYLKKKYIFGICLGFQIFANKLYEDGLSDGLNLIEADVVNLEIKEKFNIGWGMVKIDKDISKIMNLNEISSFYFCHSYYLKFSNIEEKKFCIGKTIGIPDIPAIYIKDNFIGCQFHPEKSQKNGEKIIKFFLKL